MRAISLWQPWASAIALGSKTIETRHWSTGYRGPLAIHAAKRCVKFELHELKHDTAWIGALWRYFEERFFDAVDLSEALPFGAVVATANLIDCKPTERFSHVDYNRAHYPNENEELFPYVWTEREMGDFSPGRFGWVLTNVRALQVPIPFRGAQGFFNVPDALFTGAHLKPATGATLEGGNL